MTTTAARVCLFGGALLAAGIAGPEARAQGFIHDGSYAVLRAGWPTGGAAYFRMNSGSFFGVQPLAYAAGDFSASTTVQTHLLAFTHQRTSTASVAQSEAGFTALLYSITDAPASISWDLGSWAEGYVVIEDLKTHQVLWSNPGPEGNATFAFQRERGYRVYATTRGSAGGGQSWARIELIEPCPADTDRNGQLNLDDIEAFVVAFTGTCQ